MAEGRSDPIQYLADLMHSRQTLVLSGAGLSTESGIPDYRGPQGSLRSHRPMQYREFVQSEDARRRYWARSSVGWVRLSAARPNAGHIAIARLEQQGVVHAVITQNVDRLHQEAGSRRVLELHGSLAEVRCLACGRGEPRDAFQERLTAANPGWEARLAEDAPDGDAEIAADVTAGFRIPGCMACAGVLKPDVVFFGESVPRSRVQSAWEMLAEATLLLVVGSSLAVFSGFRFVERAAREGVPVAIINQGATRGDALASLTIDGRLGEVLPRLAAAIEHRS
jgi:NAD+-dependent protein deacetylase sirtuin 4